MHIPLLGSEDYYKFKAPFNNILEDEVEYKVVETNILNNLIKKGLDPLNSIYLSNGLTEEDYNEAFSNDTPIVYLEHTSGDVYEIPLNYISNIYLNTGVPYSDRLLLIQLGTLPDGYDTSSLVAALENTVKSYLNLPIRISEEKGSGKETIADEVHTLNMETMFNVVTPLETIIEQKDTELVTLRESIYTLEQHIKNS